MVQQRARSQCVRAAGQSVPVMGTPVSEILDSSSGQQQQGAQERGLFGGHKQHGVSHGGGQGQVNSQASRLGHMVMDSAAHGFGWTLGKPACCRSSNSLAGAVPNSRQRCTGVCTWLRCTLAGPVVWGPAARWVSLPVPETRLGRAWMSFLSESPAAWP